MSTVDPNQRYVDPLEGTGLSLFVVSVVGGVVSLVVVGLRTLVRLKARNFGLDDGVMLGGLVRRYPTPGLALQDAGKSQFTDLWLCVRLSILPMLSLPA